MTTTENKLWIENVEGVRSELDDKAGSEMYADLENGNYFNLRLREAWASEGAGKYIVKGGLTHHCDRYITYYHGDDADLASEIYGALLGPNKDGAGGAIPPLMSSLFESWLNKEIAK